MIQIYAEHNNNQTNGQAHCLVDFLCFLPDYFILYKKNAWSLRLSGGRTAAAQT